MEEIVLISANKSHSKVIWDWRNDSITRLMAINSEKVSWEEHCFWYEKFLIDKVGKMYLGLQEDLPIGVIRFDKYDSENYSYNVSINIAPDKRSKGLGTQLLTHGIKRFKKEVKDCKLIRGEVKKNNRSSNKLFKSYGFSLKELDYKLNKYELFLY